MNMKSQSRERSIRQLESRWHEHSECEAVIRYHGPHWGIYCADHGTWIQWIRRDQIDQAGIDPEPRVRARDLFR